MSDQHSHDQGHDDGHVGHPHYHTHGTLDPALLTTQRGIWAIKWSLLGLLATAFFQLGIVIISDSVALLADTIHNFGDAATAFLCRSPLSLPVGNRRADSVTATGAWKIWQGSWLFSQS